MTSATTSQDLEVVNHGKPRRQPRPAPVSVKKEVLEGAEEEWFAVLLRDFGVDLSWDHRQQQTAAADVVEAVQVSPMTMTMADFMPSCQRHLAQLN